MLCLAKMECQSQGDWDDEDGPDEDYLYSITPVQTDPGDMTPVSKEEAEEMREILLPHAGRVISFQEHDELGLNPNYSNHATPRGIYGFEVDKIIDWLDAPIENEKALNKAYYQINCMGFIRRTYAFIYDLNGEELYNDTYQSAREDLGRMLDIVRDAGHIAIADRMKKQNWGSGIDNCDTHIQSQILIWMTDDAVNRMLGIKEQEGPYKQHPKKPELWRRLLVEMGYPAIYDRHNVMTGDLPNQVIAFENEVLRNVERLDNPLCLKREPSVSPMRK